jgi:hypothetical protein
MRIEDYAQMQFMQQRFPGPHPPFGGPFMGGTMDQNGGAGMSGMQGFYPQGGGGMMQGAPGAGLGMGFGPAYSPDPRATMMGQAMNGAYSSEHGSDRAHLLEPRGAGRMPHVNGSSPGLGGMAAPMRPTLSAEASMLMNKVNAPGSARMPERARETVRVWASGSSSRIQPGSLGVHHRQANCSQWKRQSRVF